MYIYIYSVGLCVYARLYLILSLSHLQGYTIPLDKRLAADGRGLQDHTINDNFAKLAQALYTADREVSPSLLIFSLGYHL